MLYYGIITVLAFGINTYNYINLGIMNIKTQKQEEIYAQKINSSITQYEQQTGLKITDVAFIKSNKTELTYLNMPVNMFTLKAIQGDYSRLHWLNYYTNRSLDLIEIQKERYYEISNYIDEDIYLENNVAYIYY